MAGIHVDKSACVWHSTDGKLNMIVPDRCDADMPVFKMKNNGVYAVSDTTGIIGNSKQALYDDTNTPITALVDPPVNFVSNNNVIFWYCKGDERTFNKNNFFPLLFSTIKMTVNADPTKSVPVGTVEYPSIPLMDLEPFYFSMYPKAYYNQQTDEVSLTFWSNVKEYTGTVLTKYPYMEFGTTDIATSKNYAIYSAISTDDGTVDTSSAYKRALFTCNGKQTTAYFNEDIVINGVHSRTGQTTYTQRTIYLFNKPYIAYIPKDSEENVVVDIGAGGGGTAFYSE